MSRSYSNTLRNGTPPHRIIIAQGDDVHTFILRKWMMALAILLSAGITFWLCAATAYVIFRDDVLAGILARNARTQQAYEDRIASMRLHIDRISSRQLVDQEALSAKMTDVLRRQGQIELRTQHLNAVGEKGRQSSLLQAPLNDDDIKTGSIKPTGESAKAAQDFAHILSRIDYNLTRVSINQDRFLSQAEMRAQDTENKLRSIVSELGLDPAAYGAKRAAKRELPSEASIGGPLIPVSSQGEPVDAFRYRTENLKRSQAQVDRIRQALKTVPLRRPVDGELDLSSGFGRRHDPFLGVMAYHAGLDFRGDPGDPIRATGSGKVESAGRDGGYGLMVEINHGNGLSTRYGHMSQINVKVGDSVASGALIGRVGSTGRSTGPHLHYETRINDEPVNPEKFLRAGQKLGS